jgi:hypothetical protein
MMIVVLFMNSVNAVEEIGDKVVFSAPDESIWNMNGDEMYQYIMSEPLVLAILANIGGVENEAIKKELEGRAAPINFRIFRSYDLPPILARLASFPDLDYWKCHRFGVVPETDRKFHPYSMDIFSKHGCIYTDDQYLYAPTIEHVNTPFLLSGLALSAVYYNKLLDEKIGVDDDLSTLFDYLM